MRNWFKGLERNLFKVLELDGLHFNLQKHKRASLVCGHFVFARRAIWAPGLTLVNYKVDNHSKHVCLNVITYITGKITKLSILFEI